MMISSEKKVYPVQKAANQQFVMDDTMSSGLLWRMQQAVFHAKMDMINFVLQEGNVPVGGSSVELAVRVVQRTIDGEATQGKWIDLPDHMHHLVTMQYDDFSHGRPAYS